jgi:hypothetical protein
MKPKRNLAVPEYKYMFVCQSRSENSVAIEKELAFKNEEKYQKSVNFKNEEEKSRAELHTANKELSNQAGELQIQQEELRQLNEELNNKQKFGSSRNCNDE